MGHDEGVAAELRGRGPARLRGFGPRDCGNGAAVMSGYDEIQAVYSGLSLLTSNESSHKQ